LAYALPTVATSIAARGLGMEHGRHLLIADSATEMAQHCIRLLKQPDDARVLGENGRDEVVRRLSWRSVGVQARSVVRELLAASAG
jgi:glycosyltransferase involved in cell wall biosynthesis